MDGENGSADTTAEKKKNVPRVVQEIEKNFDRTSKKIDAALAAYVRADSEKNQSALETALVAFSIAWRQKQALARASTADDALHAALDERAKVVIAAAQPRDAAKQIHDLVGTVLSEAQTQEDGN